MKNHPHSIPRFWEDPAVLGIGKLPACSTFEERPASVLHEKNPWVFDLDGEWDFLTFDSVDEAWHVASGGKSIAEWKRIEVPGHPEFQGFGSPHYTNIQMPFTCQPPGVPECNPTGLYRRSFEVPAEWSGLRTRLHFGSAESFLAVWINGHFVGLSKGSRTPAEFDASAFAQAGETLEMTVLVAKWCDATFIEDQDMWWLSGLPRSVHLIAHRPTHIADLRVHANPATGLISIESTIDHPLDTGVRVSARLQGPDGTLCEPQEIELASKEHGRQREEFLGSFLVEKPLLWSAETPWLYRIEISLHAAGETSLATVRTGFRSVEVRDGALLINGRRVRLFGINRHSYSPTGGRTLTQEEMLQDIRLIKRFHFNAVRCSHYPPDPHWLDLCDEHGLYVIDEADVESHAYSSSLSNDPRYATAFLDRTMRMVSRDRNHPSVILWSLGNESGYGASHDAAAGWVRHSDPTRPLHYEGAISRAANNSVMHGSPATDIVCPMYPSIRTFRFNNGSTNRNHNYPSARTPPSPRRPPIPFLRATGRSYSVNTAMPWGPATARWPITSGFSAPPSVFKAASSGSGATTESGNPTDHGPTGGISATRHMTGIFVAMGWSARIGFPTPHWSSTGTWRSPCGSTIASGLRTDRSVRDWIG